MENVNVDAVCKIACTAFSGMFSGACLYCNVVQMPALRTVSDTPSMRQCWKQSFLKAAVYQPSLAIGSAVTAGVVYYRDTSESRNLWLAGSVGISLILPWTKVIMIPDIMKLLKDDVISERGEAWVRTAIDTWDKRHFMRTVLGMTSFGIFLYALYAQN